jgi:hypothetical protein
MFTWQLMNSLLWMDLHVSRVNFEPTFDSCTQSVMYGLLRALLLMNCCYRMIFFSRGSNGRNHRGKGNWNRGHRRPIFSIHFDIDPQELNQLFQVGFFNCVGHGIMHPQPKIPHFQPPQNIPDILVPPHVSLQPKIPANDGCQEIINLSVSHHRGWPTMSLPLPPPVNPNVHISCVVSPVQSSHTSKRLKTDIPQLVQDRGKIVASSSSPSNDSSKYVSSHLLLKDGCAHVISEIHPQGSNQPRLLPRSLRETIVKKGKLSHKVENMVFKLCFL